MPDAVSLKVFKEMEGSEEGILIYETIRYREVYFYQFVGDGEKYTTKPEEWHLAPEAREVWEVLKRVNQRIEHRFQEK
ncbi:MAG: hypothetical protein JRF45_10065 [Deltaproteobacteria bacterium]|nr:hypothetical protein [Deltaproteobacteria bacterium]